MRIICVFAVFAAALLGFDAVANELRDGRYVGVEEARGAAIDIRRDPDGYLGTFFDNKGNSQDFEADAIGNGAAAVLDINGRAMIMRMTPIKEGAQVTLVPIDEKGTMLANEAIVLGFLREGARLPEAPKGYSDAPAANCTRVAAYTFMVSYQYWEPAGVMNGFRCLPDRAKTILGFFPAVQLDIVWKICQAPGSRDVLGQALRNSGLSCDGVLKGMSSVQSRGRFDAFHGEVKKERDSLIMSIRCAEGYPETRSNCERAARKLSDNAAAARTPATVLQRYR